MRFSGFCSAQNRQRPNALLRCRVDGIAQRRRDRQHRLLPDATRRLAAWNCIDLDARDSLHPKRSVIVEVALHHPAFLEDDLRAQPATCTCFSLPLMRSVISAMWSQGWSPVTRNTWYSSQAESEMAWPGLAGTRSRQSVWDAVQWPASISRRISAPIISAKSRKAGIWYRRSPISSCE